MTEQVESLIRKDYSAGFHTNIESDTLKPGLDEDVVRFISAKKEEPEWMLEWRLKAFRAWQDMEEPTWAHVHYPTIDFQALSYYSAPKSMADKPKSLAEVDPELLDMYAKLGIPLHEQEALAGLVRRVFPERADLDPAAAVGRERHEVELGCPLVGGVERPQGDGRAEGQGGDAADVNAFCVGLEGADVHVTFS